MKVVQNLSILNFYSSGVVYKEALSNDEILK